VDIPWRFCGFLVERQRPARRTLPAAPKL
jgi:hypothetical protein